MTVSETLPEKQQAVQLTGPDELVLNRDKPVFRPGPWQVLCRIEAVGLCFSDLKLLKQFSGHARKGRIVSGIDPKVLDEIPSYVPDDQATVPGHECVAVVVAAGEKAKHQVGDRALIQTDYRWLPCNGSNGSFGYNFEGGLQEYVLMDERVITSPEGESMMIPVPKDLSASAIALVEPWACVEDAYVSEERRTALGGGRLLVVLDEGRVAKGLDSVYADGEAPGSVTVVASMLPVEVSLGGLAAVKIRQVTTLDELGEDDEFDDIVYFGSQPRTIEALDQRLARHGLLNVVLGGSRIGEPVALGIGRCHYGGMRFTGTAGDSAAQGLERLPANAEIRPGDKILVIGAAGPMGQMHVVRDLCQGVEGVEIIATDFDDSRLERLDVVARPLAERNGLTYRSLNPQKQDLRVEASYTVLMAPVPQLVAQAVETSLPNGIVNIFAGIPATVFHEIDFDAYIEKNLYFIGTSGSVLRDMKIVLDKVIAGTLDTNLSVGAVCGMAGAIEGIRAVENRTLPGKIIVYPSLHDMGLTPLEELADSRKMVHEKLDDGMWTGQAEKELLRFGA